MRQDAFLACTSANAISMTASGSNVCAAGSWSARASTSWATLSSPMDSSARIWASHRSRRCSRVSPSWDLRGRVTHRGLPVQPVQLQRGRFAAVPLLERARRTPAALGLIARRRPENRSLTAWSMPRISRDLPSGRITASTCELLRRRARTWSGPRPPRRPACGCTGSCRPACATARPRTARGRTRVVDVQLRVVRRGWCAGRTRRRSSRARR